MPNNISYRDAAIHIYRIFGQYRKTIYDINKGRYEDMASIAKKNGFKLIIRDCGIYGKPRHLEKDGLQFSLHYRGGEFLADWSFYYGSLQYVHIKDLHQKLPEILASGWMPRSLRSRTTQDQNTVDAIKAHIGVTRRLVDGRSCGTLGALLKANGYHVHYDGRSVCSFSKGPVLYHASTTGPAYRWVLDDNYQCFDADGNLSNAFSLQKDGPHLCLGDAYEAVFGDGITLGRFFTERELFEAGRLAYRRYLVRVYQNKELTTISGYDTFHEANAAALSEARRLATRLPDRLKSHAHIEPKDIADEGDMLAAWMYYQYDNIRHLVFVQGEDQIITKT